MNCIHYWRVQIAKCIGASHAPQHVWSLNAYCDHVTLTFNLLPNTNSPVAGPANFHSYALAKKFV